MDRTMDFDFRFGREEISFNVNTYDSNGTMYIGLDSLDCGFPEPFADLTVNLGEILPPYHAYVDTNNLPEAEQLIKAAGIGEPTGTYQTSGFCTYPLYRFNKEKLEEYCPSCVQSYEATLKVPAKRKGR